MLFDFDILFTASYRSYEPAKCLAISYLYRSVYEMPESDDSEMSKETKQISLEKSKKKCYSLEWCTFGYLGKNICEFSIIIIEL